MAKYKPFHHGPGNDSNLQPIDFMLNKYTVRPCCQTQIIEFNYQRLNKITVSTTEANSAKWLSIWPQSLTQPNLIIDSSFLASEGAHKGATHR